MISCKIELPPFLSLSSLSPSLSPSLSLPPSPSLSLSLSLSSVSFSISLSLPAGEVSNQPGWCRRVWYLGCSHGNQYTGLPASRGRGHVWGHSTGHWAQPTATAGQSSLRVPCAVLCCLCAGRSHKAATIENKHGRQSHLKLKKLVVGAWPESSELEWALTLYMGTYTN